MMNWIRKFLGKKEVLWESTDKVYPQYLVQVIRVLPYKGQLILYCNGKIVATYPVSISFDAQFGLDPLNVESWAMLAVQLSDKHMEVLS